MRHLVVSGARPSQAVDSFYGQQIEHQQSQSPTMSRTASHHSQPHSQTASHSHSRQTSAQHHPHFLPHAQSHSSGVSASVSGLSTPLGGSGFLPPQASHGGGSGSTTGSIKLGPYELAVPPAPVGCPSFLHRILLTHDSAYRARMLAEPPAQWSGSSENDADGTVLARRPGTPGSLMNASMSASVSSLGGAGASIGSHGPRTPLPFTPPQLVSKIPATLPFLEPLIPPENFSMVNSRLYRSSLPLKKHFPFLRTLNLRSVLTLILEEYPAPNTAFLEENGIQFFQFGIPGNKEPFVHIPEDMITNALIAILDRRNHPMLIHCNKGKHRTGCLVGCLRKLQQWSLTTIFDEYRRFSAPKSRSMDQESIELYAGEAEVWARVEPRWVPDWAGFPSDRVLSESEGEEDEDDDELDGGPAAVWARTIYGNQGEEDRGSG